MTVLSSAEARCAAGQPRKALTFIFRALGGTAVTTGNTALSFTDVPAGAYYSDVVSWAVGRGVTTGTSSTTFSPDNNCTRGQIVTFLYRAYN